MTTFVAGQASVANSTLAGDQMAPFVASLAGGGSVVAWGSNADQNVYAQRYDTQGAKLGGELLVHDGTAIGLGGVTGLADGGFVVLWREGLLEATMASVQRYDAAGDPVGDSIVVESIATGWPKITVKDVEALPNGGFIVSYALWSMPSPNPSSSQYVQPFDVSGAKVGSALLVEHNSSMPTTDLAVLPDGGWVHVMDQFYGAGPYTGIDTVARQYSAAGAVVSATEINPAPLAEQRPALAVLANGAYVVAWQNQSGVLEGQLFSASGSALGAPIDLATPPAPAPGQPSHYPHGQYDDFAQLTALADGSFLLSWQQLTWVSGEAGSSPVWESEILARSFDASGQPASDVVHLDAQRLVTDTTTTPASRTAWDVAPTGDGGFLVTTQRPGDTTGLDIYTQKFSPASVPPSTPGMVMHGGNGGGSMQGTVGDDQMYGGDGRDRLAGYQGNDTLDGGNGIDTAMYSGARSQYTIAKTTNGYSVSGAEGNDTLVNVERIHFSDVNVAIDVVGHGGQAYRLYQAAFDRAPDQGGLGWWINSLDGGVSLSQVAQFFMDSAEFQAKYGAPDVTQFVAQLYANVLHRAPDDAGQAYWVNHLNHNDLTRADTLMLFSESAENQAALVGVMQQGMAYAG